MYTGLHFQSFIIDLIAGSIILNRTSCQFDRLYYPGGRKVNTRCGLIPHKKSRSIQPAKTGKTHDRQRMIDKTVYKALGLSGGTTTRMFLDEPCWINPVDAAQRGIKDNRIRHRGCASMPGLKRKHQ